MVRNAFYTGNPTKSVSNHRYLKDVSIKSRNVLFLRHFDGISVPQIAHLVTVNDKWLERRVSAWIQR